MKKLLVLVFTSLLAVPVMAQIPSFGTVQTNFLGRLTITSTNFPAGLSASLQHSTNGVDFTAVTNGWVTTSLGGQPAFVCTNVAQVGAFYRLTTSSNGVPAFATNSLTVFRVQAKVVGGSREIAVLGPILTPPQVYGIESSINLTNWTWRRTGIVGETMFLFPDITNEFFRGRITQTAQ